MSHTINFTIKSNTKPYWEQLGYKSYDDYYNQLHFIAKFADDSYYCTTCMDKECPILNKYKSDDPTTSTRNH